MERVRAKKRPKRMINPPACPRCTLNNISAKKSEEGLRDCEAQLLEMADFSLAMLQALSYAHLAAELNMSAYEDAQMHARTEHSLLTEANAEIEKLRKQNLEEIQPIKADLEDLKDGLLKQNGRLLADLALSDGIRRQQERDILAQQAELARWKPFNVRSKDLG